MSTMSKLCNLETKTLTITLPIDLHNELEEFAIKQGKSNSLLVWEAIEFYIRQAVIEEEYKKHYAIKKIDKMKFCKELVEKGHWNFDKKEKI